MSSGNHDESGRGEQLSALLDGELDEASVVGACMAWREQPAARATWHAYHLIGDVMRSEDLAGDAVRDAAFLQALRSRLAHEPVVLAPPLVSRATAQTLHATPARSNRRAWRTPAAVAAGFVVVAGVLVVTRVPQPEGVEQAARQWVAAPVQAPALRAVAASAESLPDPEVLVANGKLIRDARLDRYLAAHKQFAGSSALGVPSAFLRSATADASNR